MKNNILRYIACLAVLLLAACGGGDKVTFDLSREEILESVVKNGGTVVKVIGDEGPYSHGMTFHSNHGVNEGGWSEGVSRGTHSMNFEIEEDYFYRIHAYDGADGGALLVGVRHPVQK